MSRSKAPAPAPSSHLTAGPDFASQVLDLAGALVVVLDRQGRIVQFNGACQRATGYRLDEVKGRRLEDMLVIPEERSGVQAVFEQLRMGLYPNSFENHWRTKQGQLRYITWINTVIMDRDQEVEYIVGSGIDITERKKAQDRERDYASYLGILSESVIDFVRTPDPQATYRVIGDGLRKLLPDAVLITVSLFDLERKTLTVRELAADTATRRTVEARLGRSLSGMQFDRIEPAQLRAFKLGRLVQLKGGLYEVAFGQVPKRLCQQLERELGIGSTYAIGIISTDEVFGSVAMALPEGSTIAEPTQVETLVNQAAIALQRLEAQREVEQRERYFRSLIENANEIITIIGRDGTILYKSPAVLSELGYQPQELVGQNIFAYIHPDDLARAKPDFQAVVDNPGVTLRTEFRFRHKDGSWRVLDATGVNLLDDPAVRGIVSNSRDVTEKRDALKKIRESEERYRKFFEDDLSGDFVSTPEGKILECNPVFAAIMGFSSVEEVIKSNPHEFYKNPTDRQKYLERLRTEKKIVNLEMDLKRLDGTPLTVVENVVGIFDDHGELVKFHGYLFDITERKRAGEQLRDSEAQYRTTLEAMGDLIHLIDRDYTIVMANASLKGYLSQLGIEADIVGRTVFQAFPFLPAKVKEEYDTVFDTGRVLVTEEVTTVAGQEVWTETRKISVVEGGQVVRIVTVMRDITQRKWDEVEIREGRERFQRLADRIHEGVSIVERGRLVYVNEQALNIFGCSREEFGRKSLLDMAAPEERDKLRRLMEQSAIKDMPPEQAMMWVVRQDGSRRCVYVRTYFNRKGKEDIGYFMVTTDITEKRLNELALIESEKQYRELFENNPTPMMVYDPESLAFIAVNDAAVKHYGYSQAEFLGMTLKDIRPPEDVSIMLENVARSVKKKFDKTSMVRHRSKDGRIILVEAIGHSVQFGGREARLVMINDITEQKKIEQAIRESEEKFRTLAERSPNMIFINQGGRFTYANERCAELMGYSKKEFYDPGFDFMTLIAPEDRERIGQNYQQHLRGGELSSYEYRLVTKDGRSLEAIINTKLITMQGGPAIMGIVTDLSALHRAENLVAQQEQRFKALIENSTDAIIILDKDGRVTYSSPSRKRIAGFGPEEVEGREAAEFVHPDERANFRRRLASLASKPGRAVHSAYRILTKEGGIRHAEGSGINLLADPAVAGLVLNFKDVTDRRQAELALQASEERHRTLVETMNDGLMQVDNDDVIQFVNQRLCTMLGYAREDLLGQVSFLKLAVEEDREMVVRKNQERRTGTTDRYELRIRRKDSSIIWTMVSASPVVEADGTVTGSIGIVTDISQWKQAEQALANSQEKYRQIFDGIAEGIYRSTPDGRPLVANPALVNMLGYQNLMELLSRDIEQEGYFDRTTRESFKQMMAERGEVRDFINTWRKKDGSQLVVRENAHAVKDGQGKILYYEGTIEDITEQQRSQVALRESQRRLERLMANLPGMAFRCTGGQDWVMEFVSQGCRELTEYSPEELVDNRVVSCHDLIIPEDRKMVDDEIQHAIKDKKPYQLVYRMRTKSEQVKWVWEQGSVVVPADGAAPYLEGFITDINPRMIAEDALYLSEHQCRSTINAFGDVIFVVNRNLVIVLTNDALRESNRRQGLETEVLGKSIFEVFPSLDRDAVARAYQEVLDTGKATTSEERRQADGTETVTETRRIPIFDSGHVTRVVTVVSQRTV